MYEEIPYVQYGSPVADPGLDYVEYGSADNYAGCFSPFALPSGLFKSPMPAMPFVPKKSAESRRLLVDDMANLPWSTCAPLPLPAREPSIASVNSVRSVSGMTVIHHEPSLTPAASWDESADDASVEPTTPEPCLVLADISNGSDKTWPRYTMPAMPILPMALRQSPAIARQEERTAPPVQTVKVIPLPKTWAAIMGHDSSGSTESLSASDVLASNNRLDSNNVARMAAALVDFSVDGSVSSSRIPFLEPRGLVNTGNMCYMNAVSSTESFCLNMR